MKTRVAAGLRLVALALVAMLIGRPAAAEPAPKPANADGATVYLIGVQHAPGLFCTEALSPGHVRAALDAIDPDVVGVESNPDWFAKGNHYRFTYEAFAVAVPWAKGKGRNVVGIDWIGASNDWQERQRIARAEWEAETLKGAPDPTYYTYGATRADQRRPIGANDVPAFAFLNGPQHAAENIAWLDAEKDKAGTPQAYIAVRDRHIAEHIAAAARDARCVAVVIGAYHVGNVTRELTARGVKVGDLRAAMEAKGAPFDGSADERLEARDIAAILLQSLDGDRGIAIDPAREQRLLTRLEALAPKADDGARDWLSHAMARRSLLKGDEADVKTRWAALAASGRSTPFPFVGASWRHRLTVQQAALLELGRLADLGGDRARATAQYERLLRTIEVPEFSRDVHSDFELLARAHNAVRALLERPYTETMAFASREIPGPDNAAAQPQQPADMARGWEQLRAKQWPELLATVQGLKIAELGFNDQIEARYMTLVALLETGRKADAAAALAELEKQTAELPADHWLMRELAPLRTRVAQ